MAPRTQPTTKKVLSTSIDKKITKILAAVIVVFISIPAQLMIASFGSLHERFIPGESFGALIVGIVLYTIITYSLSITSARYLNKKIDARNEIFRYVLIITFCVFLLRFVINLFLHY